MADQPLLANLQEMIASLDAYINRRAAEIAAPHIAEAGVMAGREVAAARAGQQRAEDLVTELRRQFAGLERQSEKHRQRYEQAEAIIRAMNRLTQAMYDSDLEISWPRDAAELEAAYSEAHSVDLSGDS